MNEKVALVTGAAGGIGSEITKQLAASGYSVYATDLAIDLMEHLEGPGIEKAVIDVTDQASIDTAVASVVEQAGRIDLLVNNAGFAQLGVVECVPMDAIQREFDINVFGYGRMQSAVLPIMREQRSGHVINISSIVGKVAMPGFGWYAASKHAIEAFSDALREEVRALGISVSIIEPGLIATGFIDKQREGLAAVPHPDDYREVVQAADSIGAAGEGASPQQIGAAVVKVATASQPPARYALPLDSKALIFIRRYVGDWLLTRIMQNQLKKFSV